MTTFLLIGTGCSTTKRLFNAEIDYKSAKLVPKLTVPAGLTPIQVSNRYLVELPSDNTATQNTATQTPAVVNQ
jgi:uncharacterized lipoprotein